MESESGSKKRRTFLLSIFESFFLIKAREIYSQVRSQTAVSVYSHKNEVSMKEEKPHYAFNCYGFIDYLIQETHPKARQEVVSFMQKMQDTIPPSIDGIPCPYNYFVFFESLESKRCAYWKRVDSFEDLEPGDVIVYVGPDYVHQVIEDFQTGRTGTHMMVIDKVYGEVEGGWHLSVIDCTRSAHNQADDTRSKGKGGIGRCSLYLSLENNEIYVRWNRKKLLKKVALARLI